MPRVVIWTSGLLSLGFAVAGCQTAPARYANDGVQATYQVASTGATAVRATGGQLYVGAGAAFRAPLHDLNVMQDKIAPVLLRAESHPYDLAGVNSCAGVLDRVAELDLALGPDIDTPKPKKRTRISRGADFAASTALDAAGTAAEHFIPMRSTLKQITGATRYENHVKHAALAGTTRRSFLKAIGMEHNCSWPAAPLDFQPTQVADAAALWSGAPVTSPAQTGGAAIRLASAASPAVPAGPSSAVQASLAAPSVQPTLVAVRSAPSAAVRPARIAASRRTPPPVFVAVRSQLVIPAALPAAEPGQSWRPAPARAEMVEVSTPVTHAGLANTAVASGGAAAAAPWSAAFTSGAGARP